jgi:hypothetical protein
MALARRRSYPGAHHGKQLIAAPRINTKMVNRAAPDLFPVMSLVKKEFTLREEGARQPFRSDRVSFRKTLKIIDLLSLINWPLN